MSRAFAQQHGFIPKDAAPGFYGFSGITNLGTWPIKVSPHLARPRLRTRTPWRALKVVRLAVYQVGRKTVEQQVMLVENSYFPIILGRYVSPASVSFLSLKPVLIRSRHSLAARSWKSAESGLTRSTRPPFSSSTLVRASPTWIDQPADGG